MTMTPEQRKRFHAAANPLKDALFDLVCAIHGEGNPIAIQQRFDQANAAQRDFLLTMRAIDHENRPPRIRKKA